MLFSRWICCLMKWREWFGLQKNLHRFTNRSFGKNAQESTYNKIVEFCFASNEFLRNNTGWINRRMRIIRFLSFVGKQRSLFCKKLRDKFRITLLLRKFTQDIFETE